MAQAPRVVPVADDEYARQKQAIADLVTAAEVTGDLPIRDAITRESVDKGDIVQLDPQTTPLDQLVSAGAVRLLPPAEAKAKATPTEG